MNDIDACEPRPDASARVADVPGASESRQPARSRGVLSSEQDRRPNLHLVDWLATAGYDPERRRVLVVGCGSGDDAELLAAAGARVTAFDVSPIAITAARRRFPGTGVDYQVADLACPPARWTGTFDLIVDVHTLQVLPAPARASAVGQLARMTAPGGVVLVVARLRAEHDRSVPQSLTARELGVFRAAGLRLSSYEDFDDDSGTGRPVRRLRATFVRETDPPGTREADPSHPADQAG